SILGCGWLGLSLGKYFVEKDWLVKGSTTDPGNFHLLKEAGISPFLVKITSTEIHSEQLNEFLNAETLIVNFPPERRPDIEDHHLQQIVLLIEVIKSSPIKNVLFVSSTSVYPDLNKEILETETAPAEKRSGKALKLVEEKLNEQQCFKTTILR